MSWLLPTPTMWLKPTPLGSAQSITARLMAADCVTSATLPACGGMWDRVAFRPILGTHRSLEAAHGQIGQSLDTGLRLQPDDGDGGWTEQARRIEAATGCEPR